jgi:archaellin
MPRKARTTATKNKRRIRWSRPTARNNKRAIASTQNQIIALKRHMNLTKERMRWHCGFVEKPMSAYPFIIPLTSGPSTTTSAKLNDGSLTPVAWNETMTARNGSGGNTGNNRSSFVINKQYVDLTITSGNENALLNHTAFVIQLKDKTAQQTYSDTAGVTSLTRDADYCVPDAAAGVDSGYGAYINTDKYKIIKRLEFETVGIVPSAHPENKALSASGDVGKGTRTLQVIRRQFKINYGNTQLKSAGGPQEDGGSLVYDEINPEQKRFIVIFSNNSLLDGQQPNVSMSSLVTGYAAE